jgi:hypothetical protein
MEDHPSTMGMVVNVDFFLPLPGLHGERTAFTLCSYVGLIQRILIIAERLSSLFLLRCTNAVCVKP